MRKTILQDYKSCSVQDTARKNTQYSRNEKIGYVAKALSMFNVSCPNSEYPWIFTVLRTERKMARRFAKVLEEEIEEALFYPSDLVNT